MQRLKLLLSLLLRKQRLPPELHSPGPDLKSAVCVSLTVAVEESHGSQTRSMTAHEEAEESGFAPACHWPIKAFETGAQVSGGGLLGEVVVEVQVLNPAIYYQHGAIP